MKRLIALLLMIAALFALSGCDDDGEYPPVESTEKEATVLFTMHIGDKEYDVRYELYRAFFLTHKNEIDGGDSSVWSSEGADEYIRRMNALIIPKIADIYSTIYICEQTGFDLDSDEVDEKIDTYIKESIEGGVHDSVQIQGYGSYESYLAALRELNLNYSVQILLYKYAIAQDVIDEYYIGTLNEDNFTPDGTVGKLEYTETGVRAFYESAECALVYQGFVQQMFGKESAIKWRADIMEKAERGVNVGAAMVGKNIASTDVPTVIGKHSLDVTYYSELTNAVFSLDVGQFSDIIEVNTGYENGYFIIYREEKTNSYFTDNYRDIVKVYLDNEIGELIAGAKDKLLSDIEYTDAYGVLEHGNISMDE